jgi:hypothetical protein
MPCSFSLKLVIKKEHLERVKEKLQSEKSPVEKYDDDDEESIEQQDIYKSIKQTIMGMFWYAQPIHQKSDFDNDNTIEFYKDRQTHDIILHGSYDYGQPETGAGWFEDELNDFKCFLEYLKEYIEDTQINIKCSTGDDGNYCDLAFWNERIVIKDHIYEEIIDPDGDDEEDTDNWEII